jgi:glycosyltransferase involved in cell wall biosynthesis
VAANPPHGLVHRFRHEATYRLSRARAAFHDAVELRAKRRALRVWWSGLSAHPPDALIGANVDRSRGIRSHLLGIQHHSAGRIELAPPDELSERLAYHDLHTTLRQEFFEFSPKGIGNIHSHVYPFFIEWCHAHAREGAQWVHTYHSPYFPIGATNTLEPWEAEINDALVNVARHADVRLSVSRWQQEWLASKHGISTRYIPNGVDVGICERGDAARFHSLHPARDFVLYIGANEAVKNPAAFASLAEAMPDTTFVMIGYDLDAESLSTRWGVTAPQNLIFLGGLKRSAVQDALAACSVLVMTSHWEGLPTVALEAMVHGVPVVVPDNAGCIEAIDGGRYGFVYRQGDTDDLASCTRDAMKAGRNPSAKAHVTAQYDWRIVAPQLDEVYGLGKK